MAKHPWGSTARAAVRRLRSSGDFVDDYAVHSQLRNDLGLLFIAELDEDGRLAVRWR